MLEFITMDPKIPAGIAPIGERQCRTGRDCGELNEGWQIGVENFRFPKRIRDVLKAAEDDIHRADRRWYYRHDIMEPLGVHIQFMG